MTDTAQPEMAAETDALAQAADAFKAFTSEQPVKARDDQGRFASEQPVEEQAEPEELEAEAEAEAGDEGEADDDGQETAEQAQPLPPSWPADKAEVWETLPADAQAFIAERDAEQLRATNAKLQESANVRKAAEAAQAEAIANRTQYAQAIEIVASALYAPEPDPRQYGAGTGQYDREGYDLALAKHRDSQSAITQLAEQYQAVKAQEAQEAEAAAQQRKQAEAAYMTQVETEYRPRLFADVPALNDPAKAPAVVNELLEYARSTGFGEHLFTPDNLATVTSPEIHMLWKAQQYDRLKAAKAEPKPKLAGPAIRPGVSSPRSATRAAQGQKIMERLDREGSIAAGAAMFKHLLR